MTHTENKKKWYNNVRFWLGAVPAGAIVAIVLFLVGRPSDFQITIEPNVGEVIKGNSIKSKILVEGQHYKNNIKLITKGHSDKIDIILDPASGNATPEFESDLTISVANNIREGEYELEIEAIGAKNKVEHSSVFFLTVKNPPFVAVSLDNLFFPDGFMGDRRDILFDANSPIKPYSGSSCIKIRYNPRGDQRWAGIVWLYPNNNWGNQPNGRNLSGAKTLYFMARGSNGGEIAEFKIGGISERYTESLYPAKSIGVVTLSSDWNEYSIDLSEYDLSNVFGGFCWVTNVIQNPNGCTIFLDDIIFK